MTIEDENLQDESAAEDEAVDEETEPGETAENGPEDDPWADVERTREKFGGGPECYRVVPDDELTPEQLRMTLAVRKKVIDLAKQAALDKAQGKKKTLFNDEG